MMHLLTERQQHVQTKVILAIQIEFWSSQSSKMRLLMNIKTLANFHTPVSAYFQPLTSSKNVSSVSNGQN